MTVSSNTGQPETIGKYTILRELGQGGMGVVYLAEDSVLGRLVAIKLLPTTRALTAKRSKSFLAEARAIAHLVHPNIVTLYSYSVIDGTPLLEMEYVRGGSLAERLRSSVVSGEELGAWLRDTATALAYCHGRGVIHRDIKPGNILIDESGRAKIADFGLADFMSEDESEHKDFSVSGRFLGTPRYAPPQAWQGEPPSPDWDIYSLGAVMYECLTGRPPFLGDTPLELAKSVSLSEIPPTSSLNSKAPEPLAKLVDDMLRVDGERPVSSASQVVERLESLPALSTFSLDTDPTVSRAIRTVKRKVRRKRPSQGRAWRKIAGISLVGVLFVGLFCVSALQGLLNRPDTSTTATESSEREQTILTDTPIKDRRVFLHATFYGDYTLPEQTWELSLSDDGEPVRLIGFFDGYLCTIEFSPSSNADRLDLSGNWASYRDDAGNYFDYGAVMGVAAWEANPPSFVGTIELVSARDNVVISHTFVANRNDKITSHESFARALQESDLNQSLLFAELPFLELGWPSQIEEAIAGANIFRVSLIEDDPGGLEIDGQFLESPWKTARRKEEYVLKPSETLDATVDGALFGAASPNTMYVGISIQGLAKDARPALQLGLLSSYLSPMDMNPELIVQAGEDGCIASLASSNSDMTVTAPEVQFASSRTDSTWQCELSIPLNSTEPWLQTPAAGSRWRVACEVVDAGKTAKQEIASWCYSSTTGARTGALMIFESP